MTPMHGKGTFQPLVISLRSIVRCLFISHSLRGGSWMQKKVALRQQFHTYRQVQKEKRAAGSTKTKRRLSKIAYKAGAVSLLETLVAAQHIGPRIAKKSPACRHFLRRCRATIHQWRNFRTAIVVNKTRIRPLRRRRLPSRLSWGFGRVPRYLYS